MSNFKTTIPKALDEVKKLLPKDAFIEKATLNAQTGDIEVIWHSSRLHTGFTFPLEFSLEQLAKRDLPKGVKDLPQGPRHAHLQQEKPAPESGAEVPVPVKVKVPRVVTPRPKKPKPVTVKV